LADLGSFLRVKQGCKNRSLLRSVRIALRTNGGKPKTPRPSENAFHEPAGGAVAPFDHAASVGEIHGLSPGREFIDIKDAVPSPNSKPVLVN
jgi:hypothetical protein